MNVMLAARRVSPLQLVKASRVPVRAMSGPVKVYDCEVDALNGPYKVERTEPKHEMGVLYQPGVPSPLEGTLSIDVIVVDGLHAKTGGDALGSPLHYIKLSSWFDRQRSEPRRAGIVRGIEPVARMLACA